MRNGTGIDAHQPVEIYSVVFLLFGLEDDLVCEVLEEDHARLRRVLFEAERADIGFFTLGCVSGNSIAVNMAHVQAVQLVSDLKHFVCSESPLPDSVRVCLRGREPLELRSQSMAAVFDFFMDLESGHEGFPYPRFDDMEDSPWTFLASEIVWASTPSQFLKEGEREAAVRDGYA